MHPWEARRRDVGIMGVVIDEVWGDEGEVVRAAVEWAAGRVVRPTDSKTTARPASELAAAAGRSVTAAGIGGTEALRVFRDILVPATRSQEDPMNLAYVPSAPTRAAVAFDLVTSAANVFAGLWEAGAGAIYAENEALGWIIELLGWPASAGGCFVSGGTIGNLSALTAARHAALARRGERPAGGWRLACTADAHSSVRAAARVLDVGIVEVTEDARGHLTGEALGEALGERPDDVFAVVASAGTTNAGLVDDLASVAATCRQHGVWLHVDGAYGGAALAPPASAVCSTASSSRIASLSTRISGCSRPMTVVPCFTVTRTLRAPRTRRERATWTRSTARPRTRQTSPFTCPAARMGCRSGSALPPTASTATSRLSSGRSRRRAPWPRRYAHLTTWTSSASQSSL